MNILCPGVSPWAWMPQRPQQLLRAAARAGHRCFYVEPHQNPMSGAYEAEPGIRIYGQLEAARQAAAPSYLLYFTNLLVADLLPRLRGGPVLFDAVDDFPGYESLLARCASAADHVICTSSVLAEQLWPLRPDVVCIPNACDYDHWAAVPGRYPVDVAVLPRPLAVFVGAVAEWVDLDLVAAVARSQPQAGFLVVGPHLTDAYARLDRPHNLWAFGRRDYAELPAYAHAAAVLLLPFRAEMQAARAANPVKLWEYLATGKPIVATATPELSRMGAEATIVPRDEFVAAVGRALSGSDDSGAVARRRATAASNTWADRWRAVEHLANISPAHSPS